MTAKLIAAAVVAALLLSGGGPPAAQTPGKNTAAPTPTEAQTAAILTAEEAEAAALAHAGFTAAEVSQLRSHYDADDRAPAEWDVEFRSGDWEYDYSVDPFTGTILAWERDYEPVKTAPPATEPPAAQSPATQPPAAQAPKYLTEQEAQAIALAHAGLTADQVTRLQVEFDRDDGKPEYDVEFRCGGMEYEYEIHAESGKILSWDQERDD